MKRAFFILTLLVSSSLIPTEIFSIDQPKDTLLSQNYDSYLAACNCGCKKKKQVSDLDTMVTPVNTTT